MSNTTGIPGRFIDVAQNDVAILSGGLTCIACVALIYLYLKHEKLQTFPSNLLLWRAVCDLVLGSQIVYLALNGKHLLV